MKTGVRLAVSSVIGLVVFCLLLFVPAGTLNYWQAWAFLGTFTVASLLPTIYLARTNPAAMRRRMRAGPQAETRTAERIIMTATSADIVAMLVFSALDHRMGWSHPPGWVSVLGDVLVAAGLGMAMLVVIQNGYAAATITVEQGQPVVSTGLYGWVRHPMYVGSVVMMVGMPLALGSYWGLLFVLGGLVVLVWRILDEETLLNEDLTGYRDYTRRVRYRLVPGVW